MVLNKEIQSQQRLDSLAEAPGPASPRQPRKTLVSSESYLQRLSMASSGSLWQEIPVVRNSTVLLSMTHEDQKLQEVLGRAGAGLERGIQEGKQSLIWSNSYLILTTTTKSRPTPLPTHHTLVHAATVSLLPSDGFELLSECHHYLCLSTSSCHGPLTTARFRFRLIQSDHASECVGRSAERIPSLLLQA